MRTLKKKDSKSGTVIKGTLYTENLTGLLLILIKVVRKWCLILVWKLFYLGDYLLHSYLIYTILFYKKKLDTAIKIPTNEKWIALKHREPRKDRKECLNVNINITYMYIIFSATKSWVCIGNIFLKLPNSNVQDMLQKG